MADFALTARGAAPTAGTGSLPGLQGATTPASFDIAAAETPPAVLQLLLGDRLGALFGSPDGGMVQPQGGGAVQRVADPIFGAAVINPFGLTVVGYSASRSFADIDADGDLDAFVGTLTMGTRKSSATPAAPARRSSLPGPATSDWTMSVTVPAPLSPTSTVTAAWTPSSARSMAAPFSSATQAAPARPLSRPRAASSG